MKYHIMCSNPGMHRGGHANPAHKAYDPGAHTPAQLRELLADPHIAVVIGEALTEEHIAALEAEAEMDCSSLRAWGGAARQQGSAWARRRPEGRSG